MKNDQKRVLTVQDVSCVGQCSVTVALPIISALGVETAVIPSAVLSTHTGSWTGYTFRDLTEDIPLITEHWLKNDMFFDGLYTGYVGSTKQLEYIGVIREKLLRPGAPVIIDPVMGDNGKLYAGFTAEFPKEMAKFISGADVVLPNITEAALMTGNEYKTEYDKAYIEKLICDLRALGAKSVVLTGVSFDPAKLGICVWDEKVGKFDYRFEDRIMRSCHGTGDVFASVFVGSYLGGKSMADSGVKAARFVREAMLNTDEKDHVYGVNFEGVIPKLFD